MTAGEALMTRVLSVLAAIMLALVAPVAAQTYPDKPIRVIVPFPAGGGGDTLARLVMTKVGEVLGATVVIDNRAGAGGNIGTEAAARAEPDGYTLAYGTNGTHAINHTLYKRTGFDPINDFTPISRLTQIALILVVNPGVPAASVSELLNYLKANAGKLNFASTGNGTSSHLAGELFKSVTGVNIVHVPYRGGALAMTDLIGGQVQMMIEVMPNAYPQVEGGKLRGLAVTTAKRWPTAPTVPTFAEAGVASFEVTAWDALFAPRGTPKPIIDKLNAAVRKVLDDGQLRAALLARGAEPVSSSPEELASHVASEVERWGKVVRASGATVD
jgi:tripartite-type tricarboxylate transporter receptor subunit TctC